VGDGGGVVRVEVNRPLESEGTGWVAVTTHEKMDERWELLKDETRIWFSVEDCKLTGMLTVLARDGFKEMVDKPAEIGDLVKDLLTVGAVNWDDWLCIN